MSQRTQIVVVTMVLALAFASCAIARLYSHSLGFKVGIPSLLVSGWAFFGHFITLDDDAPGGFFNAEASSPVWRHSLIRLLVKGVLSALVCILVFSGL